jgi:hypothetical protein
LYRIENFLSLCFEGVRNLHRIEIAVGLCFEGVKKLNGFSFVLNRNCAVRRGGWSIP